MADPTLADSVSFLLPFVGTGGVTAIIVAYLGSRRPKPEAPPARVDIGFSVPQWLVVGPVNDGLGAIHDIAEQSRITNQILGRLESHMQDCEREMRAARQVLELIRNESRLR